jgi:endonuclease/exonuclease/phosphatase family metal-dependent hydrolase
MDAKLTRAWPTLGSCLLLACTTLIPTKSLGSDLKILSLNLHGYHPMAESTRLLQGRDLRLRPASPHLHYFRTDELERGHEHQLRILTEDFSGLAPHVILLQEVGAGLPHSAKSCDEFHSEDGPDRLGKNSAIRLRDRLNTKGFGYVAALACRGNVGWQTFADTFRDERLMRQGPSPGKSPPQVVFDFGENPYPSGFLVEGTAILVRPPWRILESRAWRLPIPHTSEEFFFQTTRIRHDGDARWYVVANLHAGHKVRHFEQAVEIKAAIARLIENHPDRANYGGAIVGGDFNARLHRPSGKSGEVSAVPWEVIKKGEFNYGPAASDLVFEDLKNLLWALNLDPGYKPWAGLGPSASARTRVNRAVDDFMKFVRSPLSRWVRLRELLEEANQNKTCRPPTEPRLQGACQAPARIDFIFATPQLAVQEAFVLYSENDFQSVSGTTDHPGIWAELSRH